jgi:hypothetical protein
MAPLAAGGHATYANIRAERQWPEAVRALFRTEKMRSKRRALTEKSPSAHHEPERQCGDRHFAVEQRSKGRHERA